MIRTLAFFTLLTLLAVARPVAGPSFWQAATQADFLRGDIENLSIDEHGRVMLGPELITVHDASVPAIWTVVAGQDEAHFLGTGSEGRVVRVDRAGRGTVFFDSQEMDVHALASAGGGALYAGTSPDGRVYRVDAKGQATTFFDPPDKYIWALAVDPQGIVFVATGDKGIVYRVTPDGKGTPFFTTKSTHAISLAFDRSGSLLVGTGGPGRIFRLDSAGRGFLLLDTPYQEVRALRFDAKGVLYAAAQTGRPMQGGDSGGVSLTPEPTTPAPVPSVSTEITAITVIDVPVSAQAGGSSGLSGDRRGATGAVYRVLPNGLWDQVWETRDDAPYDVAIEPDGSLTVATGPRGKIFRLSGDALRPTLLTRVQARQATVLLRGAGATLVATSNPGQLVSLAAGRAARGVYESEVRDARVVSTWGTLAWRAALPEGTRVELQTRAGNTRTPDEGWSEWSAAYADATGAAISSPNARYLQWRAVLTGKERTPVLTSVSASYQQRNIRPSVASITVHPPGVVFKKPFSSGETEIAGFDADTMERRVATAAAGAPALGPRTYQKGLQTFAWKAEDDNGDQLAYAVWYRREGDTTWKRLKADLEDTILVWDTGTVPNGTYVVKVVASDRRSNPAESALDGEMESASFDIDNTVPTVSLTPARREGAQWTVGFEVADADSPVARVEYSVDAGAWQAAFPQDGMLDARRERFVLRFDASLGGRAVVIRVTDVMNNVGYGEIVLR